MPSMTGICKSISIRSKSSFSRISRAICPFSACVTDYSPANQEFICNKEIYLIIFCNKYLFTFKTGKAFRYFGMSAIGLLFLKFRMRGQTGKWILFPVHFRELLYLPAVQSVFCRLPDPVLYRQNVLLYLVKPV